MKGGDSSNPPSCQGFEPLSLAQELSQIVALLTDDCWKFVLI